MKAAPDDDRPLPVLANPDEPVGPTFVEAQYEGDEAPQNLTWNVLFDAGGEVRREMAEWLAADHGLYVTRDEDLVGAGVVDEDDRQLEVVLVRPGEILPSRVVGAIEDVVTSYWLSAEDGVEFSAAGYPPLPATWAFGKPYPDVHIPSRYLGHPVFWLPEDILRPYGDDENTTVRCVRLSLELVARGLMNPETGDVVDVLVANGLDYRDETVGELLAEWRLGYDVPELADLVLEPPEDAATAPGGPQWARIAATQQVREMWPDIERAELEDLNGQIIVSTETIDQLTLPVAMTSFEEVGRRWFASERTTEDSDELLESVDAFLGVLAEVLTRDWLFLVHTAQVRAAGVIGDPARADADERLRSEIIDSIEAALRDGESRTHALVERARTARPGTGQDLLDELWGELAALWTRWVSGGGSACQEAVATWLGGDPVEADEFTIGPPPAVTPIEGAGEPRSRAEVFIAPDGKPGIRIGD